MINNQTAGGIIILLFPIINRHATWLVVNPIQGCPNSCKYCFLQSINGTGIRPIKIADECTTIGLIKKSKYYSDKIPLCLFSQTDIFSTPSNITYLKEFLGILNERKFNNPIILITKCFIPGDVIELLRRMVLNGLPIVVYLSYSGLDSSIEVGIKEKWARKNFLSLKAANIPTIHYFRPIIPLNASSKRIDEILSFVSQYAAASVVAGLKVEESFLDKMSFWPQVSSNPSCVEAECVWPKGAKEVLRMISQKYSHPIFETNTCALSFVLGIEEQYGFYDSLPCRAFNICPDSMRTKCKNCSKSLRSRDPESITATFKHLLKRLNIDSDSLVVSIVNDHISVQNVPLTVEDICYLSGELHMRIECESMVKGNYWNTSVNRKTGLEI